MCFGLMNCYDCHNIIDYSLVNKLSQFYLYFFIISELLTITG